MDKQIKVKSVCNAVDLLAALYNKDRDALRLKFGLPVTYRTCLTCGIRLRNENVNSYCRPHWMASKLIWVSCSNCGKLFQVNEKELISKTNHKQPQNNKPQEFWFCSSFCRSSFTGKHYGFREHPENVRFGSLARWKK